MVMKKREFKSAALQWTYNHYIGKDKKRVEEYEQEVINAEIGRKIYDLRTKAGLSQRELAKKVGTTASTICRLEDADYDGHSLYMLKRTLRLSTSALRFASCLRNGSNPPDLCMS